MSRSHGTPDVRLPARRPARRTLTVAPSSSGSDDDGLLGADLLGADRERFAAALRDRYEAGTSIRLLQAWARETHRLSLGFVAMRDLLLEAGTVLRPAGVLAPAVARGELRSPRQLSDQERAEIVTALAEAYQDGESSLMLAQRAARDHRLYLANPTVLTWLRQQGVPRRPPKAFRPERLRLAPELQRRYEAGATLGDLAVWAAATQGVRMDASDIGRLLKHCGVQLRSPVAERRRRQADAEPGLGTSKGPATARRLPTSDQLARLAEVLREHRAAGSGPRALADWAGAHGATISLTTAAGLLGTLRGADTLSGAERDRLGTTARARYDRSDTLTEIQDWLITDHGLVLDDEELRRLLKRAGTVLRGPIHPDPARRHILAGRAVRARVGMAARRRFEQGYTPAEVIDWVDAEFGHRLTPASCRRLLNEHAPHHRAGRKRPPNESATGPNT